MIRFLILLFVAGVSSQQPEVTTTLGVLKGLTLKSENGRPFFGFKGIPYAKPPIGKHRFKQSVPGGKWLGVLNATRTPNMCLQRVGLGMLKEHYPLEIMGSEDCLYLNIFTPKLPADLPDGKLLDVVFNIHGGAFQILSGDVVGPEYIMDRDVVYVSINYRLGLLGFLSLEDKSCPGNNGLKDQNLALKWVNKHIAAFGGDPNKITIVGCSAGGASVHYHLLSPLSRGLFRKAISNSGAIHNPWALTKKPKEKAMVIAEAVGCPTNDTVLLLECLRDRPAEELVGSIKLFEVWKHLPVSPMGPVIEVPSATAFIDQQPDDLIKSKNINDVPVLFSHNNDEGSMFTVMTIENPEEVAEVDERWDFLTPIMYEMADTTNPYNGKELPQLIRSHYMGTKKLSEALPQLIQSIGDRFFVAGIQRAALLHAEHQSSPVYMYKFSYPGKEFNAFNKIVEKYNPDPGAPHCLDSCFVYKLTVISMGLENSTEAMVMSKTMIDYHMKFITETPVPEWSTVKSGLPNLKLLDIVSTDPSKNEFKIEEPVALKFWDSLNLLENSEEKVNPTAVHSEL